MPLNFEQAAIQQPKIDIIGKEVPLAALDKTGNILQERYDKSYEDYNKFQELSAQTEQIADPLERQRVKDYMASMQPELQKIQESGDFHNMRWQTQALANRAANNLSVFGKRAETIGKIREAINTAESLKDPRAKKFYEDKLNAEIAKTTYNPETKLFDFQSINTPKVVGDFNYADAFLKSGSGWKASANGFTNGDVEVIHNDIRDKDGKLVKAAGVYNFKTGRAVEEVKAKEVRDNIERMVVGMPGALEAIKRDTEIYMEDHPGADPQQAYQTIYNQKVKGVAAAVGEKESYTKTETEQQRELANENAQKQFGFGLSTGTPYYEDFSSNPVPSEESPVVQELLNNKYLGVGTGLTAIRPQDIPQVQFIVQGMQDEIQRLRKSKEPADQDKLNQLMKAGVGQIYVKLKNNQAVTHKDVYDLKEVLKNVSVPMTSAYKFFTSSDQRLKAELDARFPDNAGKPDKQMEQLNKEVLSAPEGLDISKTDNNWINGNMAGYDLLDPLTGQYAPLSSAVSRSGDGLKLENAPAYGSTMMKITGKVVPGTVLHGLSDNPQANLSHFGTGYTVSINGKNYIMANRENRGTRNAVLNDLAGFTRIARHPVTYQNSNGKEVKVESDGENVYVNGKKYQKDDFNKKVNEASQRGQYAVDAISN